MEEDYIKREPEPIEEALRLLGIARREILHLRDMLKAAAAKADAYERQCQLLDLIPSRPPSVGFGEDFAWRIERFLDQNSGEAQHEKVEGGSYD